MSLRDYVQHKADCKRGKVVTPVRCPNCQEPMNPVRNTSGYLNSDQFDAVKAGDWFCKRHDEATVYVWEHDLPKHGCTCGLSALLAQPETPQPDCSCGDTLGAIDPYCPAHFPSRVAPAAVAVPMPANGWQPIETAPKDGTYMVLLLPSGFRYVIGRWFAFGQEIHGSTGFWEAHATTITPTHWIPLPAAPGEPER